MVTNELRPARAVGHYGGMNADQVAALRALLAPTGWLERTRSFARALREHARTPQGLLIVGTPQDEPWHMTAHLADEARLTEIPELAPTLVRWSPPAGAPPHLRVGIERLEAATRGETLLVISPQAAPAELLERLNDARRTGAAILALDRGDPELTALAHEALAVPPDTSPLSFDAAQHLISAAVGEAGGSRLAQGSRRGVVAEGALAVGGAEEDGAGGAYGGDGEGGAAEDQPGGAAGGAAEDQPGGAAGGWWLRSRLAQLLDAVSGTPAD